MTGKAPKSVLKNVEANPVQKRSLQQGSFQPGSTQPSSIPAMSTPVGTLHIVPVVWHVVHQNEYHKLTQGTVLHQINMLNLAYKNTTTFFQLKTINYINDPKLVHLQCCETPQEKSLKAHRIGGKETLNVFSADSGYHKLFMNIWRSKTSSVSWSTFPDSPLEMDGVVVSTDRLSYDNSLPTTLIHEIGHWLGLLHTFRGGCTDPNDDFVTDTPKAAEPQRTGENGKSALSWEWKCNQVINTCPNSPGFDAVANFMDYTNCRASFSQGQIARIEFFRSHYRQSQQRCAPNICWPVSSGFQVVGA